MYTVLSLYCVTNTGILSMSQKYHSGGRGYYWHHPTGNDVHCNNTNRKTEVHGQLQVAVKIIKIVALNALQDVTAIALQWWRPLPK